MPLAVLDKYDTETAGEILAAAALSTSPMPFETEDSLVIEHKDQVDELLKEIRQRLNIRVDDISSAATASIGEYISKSIDTVLLSAPAAEAALKRAGQAGRLSPALYKVEQHHGFVERFYALTFKKHLVQEVINSPDEVQHLLNESALEGDRDNLSLFLKKYPAGKHGQPHWLLVQTVREGMVQKANAAWRVFPSDVNLIDAGSPHDVLKQFVDTFGVPVTVGAQTAKFIEAQSIIKDAPVSVSFHATNPHEIYMSYSVRGKTDNPLISKVGIAYAIDITRYKAALKRHGFNV